MKNDHGIIRKMKGKKQAQPVKSGFTMVEFSLASAFVAVLLITISGVVMNITEIYRKGLTLKTVNSVGRSVVDEIEDSISGGGSTATEQGSITNQELSEEDRENLILKGDSYTGALCAGKYTFIWNTREAFRKMESNGQNHAAALSWSGGSRKGGKEDSFKLVKVLDEGRLVCENWEGDDNSVKNGESINLQRGGLSVSNVEDLLNSSDIELFVYSVDLTTVMPDTVGTQAFIAGEIRLGTDREDTKLTGKKCENADNKNEYCALNDFKFAARTAGKGV